MNPIFKTDFNMFFDIFREGSYVIKKNNLTGGYYRRCNKFFYDHKFPTIFFPAAGREKGFLKLLEKD